MCNNDLHSTEQNVDKKEHVFMNHLYGHIKLVIVCLALKAHNDKIQAQPETKTDLCLESQ